MQSRSTTHKLLNLSLSALCGANLITSANAQENFEFLILGPAMTAEFQGSDDYNLVPMIVSQFNAGQYRVEIEGLTGRITLFERNNWQFGLATQFDFGRDQDVENDIIARMEDIDSVFNLGAFITRNMPNLLSDEDNLEVRLTTFIDTSNTHEGAYGNLSAAYTFPLMLPFRIEVELETTYANSDYLTTYFGVSAVDASSTSLPAYHLSSGFRDITLSTNLGYFTSPKWGAFSRLGITQYLGDVADSPIVELGSDTNFFVGAGVFYRF